MKFIKRYFYPEIISTITTILAGILAQYFFGNPILTALAATVGENIGYYGKLFYDDVKERKEKDGTMTLVGFLKIFRNMILEFGPGELLDTITRPIIIYFTLGIFDNITVGLFFGKVLADILFYIPTMYMYVFRKKHFDD